ncbi:MAG TPA: CBS domain-containing protein [Pyrinomonadaceae bacterium]
MVEKRKAKKRIANDKGRKTEAERLRESGMPGGGQGRKDRIEKSGVYPAYALPKGPARMMHGEASWGQGERGAAGYEDSGGSELIYLGEELGVVGGGTEGESGAYKRAEQMKGASTMKCKEIMTKDPVCCLPGDTVDQAAQLMKDEDVGSVPVVADQQTKRLLGIVTDRDLAVKVVAEARQIAAVKVEEVMTRNPATCHDDDDLQKAIDAMEQHQVRRIPIVDNDGRIVGIIAQADVATRINEPEQTAEVVAEISKSAAGG